MSVLYDCYFFSYKTLEFVTFTSDNADNDNIAVGTPSAMSTATEVESCKGPAYGGPMFQVEDFFFEINPIKYKK